MIIVQEWKDMTRTEYIIDDDFLDDETKMSAESQGYLWKLIRCKDCKFAAITDGVYGREPKVKYCDIWFPNEAEYMPVNYYCASAERKEE